MDKFLGQVVHEAAKIGRKLFLDPFQGHSMVTQEEVGVQLELPWEDSPLSPSELNVAKVLIAQKLDTHWEDR